jgi:tetratricopeptide (TPR) repeat protein
MINWFIRLINYFIRFKKGAFLFLNSNAHLPFLNGVKYFQLFFIISLFPFFIYFNSLGNQYTTQDEELIFKDNTILTGVKGISDIVLNKNASTNGFLNLQHPLASVTFALEQQLIGVKDPNLPLQYAWDINLNGTVEPDEDTNQDFVLNAQDFMLRGIGLRHFNNLLFFVFTLITAFVLLARYLNNKLTYVSFFCIILFASHPLNSSIVNGLSNRSLLLSLFFIVLNLLFFFRFMLKGGNGNLWLLILTAFFAFLSSEYSLLLTLFYPVLIYIYFPNSFSYKNIKQVIIIVVAIASVLFSAQSAASSIVLMLFALFLLLIKSFKDAFSVFILGILLSFLLFFSLQSNTGLMEKTLSITNLNYINSAALNTTISFSSVLFLLGEFLSLFIFPFPLIVNYSHLLYNIPSGFNFNLVIALFSIVLFLMLIVVGLKNKKQYTFSVYFFLLSLVPFLLFSKTIPLFTNEFKSYHALFAFCFCIAFLINSLLVNIKSQSFRKTMMIFVFVIPLLFSFITINRNAQWKNEKTLIESDYSNAPENVNLIYRMANVKYEDALLEKHKKNQIAKTSESIALCRKGLMLSDENFNFIKLKALNYIFLNNLDSVVVLSKKILLVSPLDKEINNALSYYSKLEVEKGIQYFQKGKSDSALFLFKKAVAIDEKCSDAFFNMAVIQKQKGDTTEAIALLNQSIAIKNKQEYINLLRKLKK